jgi:ferredoxin-NADP reductase
MAIPGASSGSPVIEASDAMPTRLLWQNAVIVAKADLTPRVKSFTFHLPQPFGFFAGQHVDVRLTAPDGYSTQRSYSIASAPGARDIELAVELLADGEVSPFFHEVAAVGDEIELRGPIGGHFIWRTDDGGPLLLIGGGSGVVPLMSMVRHRAATGTTMGATAPVLLLLSARNWDEAIWRDELIALDDKRDGFEFVMTLTRDAARRPRDFARRLDVEMMKDLLARLPAPPRRVFVCGANRFVEAATQSAIACGVDAAIIATERYGG